MCKPDGFTLFEMAIVIVVIALIMSGAFVGRNMLAGAEIRTIIAEQDMYAKAFKEFFDRYQALPGDMNNAEATWGADAACPSTDYTTLRRTTCNGDANGTIGTWSNGSDAGSNQSRGEIFRAWQHIANAGLIDVRLTGNRASATYGHTAIGTNIPRSKISRASGWSLLYMASSATDSTYFLSSLSGAAFASHVLMFGGNTTSTSLNDGLVLKPDEARNIDEKIDDSLPFTGNVRTMRRTIASATNNCTTAATALTDTYRLTHTQNACQLIFLMGM